MEQIAELTTESSKLLLENTEKIVFMKLIKPISNKKI